MAKSKLRQSAKGQECMIRIPGYCNHNPETTVLAHLGGAGMGLKCPDIHAAFACSACHDVVDGRVYTEYTPIEIELWHYHGVRRTQEWWIENGFINTK